MLKRRELGLEAVNKMFGTNITVKFANSWEVREEAQHLALEQETNPESNEVTEDKGEENKDVQAE